MDFYVNGENVGYLEDFKPFIIPARGYNDITFGFTLNPQFVIHNIVDIIAIATKKKDAIVTLDGVVKIKSGFVKAAVPIKCNCSIKNMDCSC